MHRKLIALTLLAVFTSLALVACGGSDSDSTPTPPPTATPDAPPTATPDAPLDGTVVNLQDLGVSGSYAFSPSEFTFSVGETVTFTLISETEFHTFTANELGIDQDVNAGETVTLTFTFDTPGTFKLICIPHEALDMVGTITVR